MVRLIVIKNCNRCPAPHLWLFTRTGALYIYEALRVMGQVAPHLKRMANPKPHEHGALDHPGPTWSRRSLCVVRLLTDSTCRWAAWWPGEACCRDTRSRRRTRSWSSWRRRPCCSSSSASDSATWSRSGSTRWNWPATSPHRALYNRSTAQSRAPISNQYCSLTVLSGAGYRILRKPNGLHRQQLPVRTPGITE